MQTDDFIAALSLDLEPVAPVRARLATAAAGGALASLILMALWLGFRHDIALVFGNRMFWMKALTSSLVAVAGFLALERLARPAGSPRQGLTMMFWVFAALAILGSWQVMITDADQRQTLMMGQSFRVCPRNILALALPILAASLWVLRGLGPTRLALTGAVAGLFSGGLAATVYGLHCPEHTMTFVAIWYSLGMLAPAALGAALGPWVLRWR